MAGEPELLPLSDQDVRAAASLIVASKMVGIMHTIESIDRNLMHGDTARARAQCQAILVEAPHTNEAHVLNQIIDTVRRLRSHARESTDVRAMDLLAQLDRLIRQLN